MDIKYPFDSISMEEVWQEYINSYEMNSAHINSFYNREDFPYLKLEDVHLDDFLLYLTFAHEIPKSLTKEILLELWLRRNNDPITNYVGVIGALGFKRAMEKLYSQETNNDQ